MDVLRKEKILEVWWIGSGDGVYGETVVAVGEGWVGYGWPRRGVVATVLS